MGSALPVPPAQHCFEQGVRHQAAGEVDAATDCFRQTVALWPGCAEAWVNLGLLNEGRDAFDEALSCYRRAAASDPTLYEAALNEGALLARLKRFDEAEAADQRAIRLRPQAPAAWSNLGALLTAWRRDADALGCLQHALALDPLHRGARFNLSYLLLRQGRLAEGFLCLEARGGPAELLARIALPRWSGDALGGRSLLVVSDAGHGDMIQMARYAAVLKQRGAGRLLLCCQPALKRLLALSGGFDDVRGYDEPLPEPACELWAPAMSLPFLCGTRLDDIPNPIPYLRAEPAGVASWHEQLGSAEHDARLRVGLVWRGNPRNENDADRSLPKLDLLAPLGRVPGLRLVSLQHGAGEDEARTPPAGLPLETLAEPLGDFAETAAIVANLDLVIGVDTSTVHLAAALGKPTWVLLPEYKTDWRWLEERSDSPWYPGVVRLFRQRRAGDWAPVVAEVTAALRDWRPA